MRRCAPRHAWFAQMRPGHARRCHPAVGLSSDCRVMWCACALLLSPRPGVPALGAAGVCCPGAARPALCCPAAGEGLRGRQRRSAVKLTLVIIPPDSCCRTVGNGRGSGRTKGIFVDGRTGPTMLFWGFFFYWPESGFLVKNRRACVTNGCRRHFDCPIQHLARVDENSI